MNRIILIGNGFDLAHGLKTSYANFIDWYWTQWGELLLQSNSKVEKDDLCLFKLKDTANANCWAEVWANYNPNKRKDPSKPWDAHEAIETAKQDRDLCTFSITSPFFREVCKDVVNKGWVDIENVYYSYLGLENNSPETLNNDLDFVRERLMEYLDEVQKDVTIAIVKNGIKEIIGEPFRVEDISVGAMEQNPDIMTEFKLHTVKGISLCPERTMLLSFNYTVITDKYYEADKDYIINHIHGELRDRNSVIFGYGDELDEHYKTIVNKNDNEYLRNIKSIKYLESSRYRDMLEFIGLAPYQIYIMGHSCGNSDRTLLNTLFEHKNCISIKPYYYRKPNDTDNYMELVQNISRNFTDMKLMRDRVVYKTLCKPL